MVMLQKIFGPMAVIARDLSEMPLACVWIATALTLLSIIILRSLIGALLQMHRSKTMVKKLKKDYTFWQKLLLKPAWEHCIHARDFCRIMIVLHHIRSVLYLGAISMLALSGMIPVLALVCGWVISAMMIMDVAIVVKFQSLDQFPFYRRKHRFRFEKYHNTKDHGSLY